MAEEKKPEAVSDKPVAATEQPKKEETTKPSAPTPAQAPNAPKKEKPSTCAGCNKSIKKKRWYYRDGKYYCTKRCWKNAAKKIEKAKSNPTEEKK